MKRVRGGMIPGPGRGLACAAAGAGENPPMEFAEVTCPTCFETFEVAVPPDDELPAEMDYDCEICCRPMVIVFSREGVWAKGLGE